MPEPPIFKRKIQSLYVFQVIILVARLKMWKTGSLKQKAEG